MSESNTSFQEAGDNDESVAASQPTRNIETILRIPVAVQVILGSAMMPVANLLKLGRGAVIPLDHRVGEPVDIIVNGRIIARGEIVVVRRLADGDRRTCQNRGMTDGFFRCRGKWLRRETLARLRKGGCPAAFHGKAACLPVTVAIRLR